MKNFVIISFFTLFSMSCGVITGGTPAGSTGAGTTSCPISQNTYEAGAAEALTDSTNTPFRTELAQSFKLTLTAAFSHVQVLLQRSGSYTTGSNITVSIQSDSGAPSGTTLASSTIDASLVGTTASFTTVALSTTLTLSTNTTYWLVLVPSFPPSANYIYWMATANASTDSYANGIAEYFQSPAWKFNFAGGSNKDFAFKIGDNC